MTDHETVDQLFDNIRPTMHYQADEQLIWNYCWNWVVDGDSVAQAELLAAVCSPIDVDIVYEYILKARE